MSGNDTIHIKKEVVVLGAGLTGLTTSFYLNKKNKDFVVLESANRVGGVINTVKKNGFTFEEGPNTGVLSNLEVVKLLEDLGDECKIEVASDSVKKRYILKDGKWNALPHSLKSAINTPLFTLKDKFRILGEPFRKKVKIQMNRLPIWLNDV